MAIMQQENFLLRKHDAALFYNYFCQDRPYHFCVFLFINTMFKVWRSEFLDFRTSETTWSSRV